MKWVIRKGKKIRRARLLLWRVLGEGFAGISNFRKSVLSVPCTALGQLEAKVALIIAHFECSTRRGIFRISAAIFLSTRRQYISMPRKQVYKANLISILPANTLKSLSCCTR